MGKSQRDKGERAMCKVREILEAVYPDAQKRSQYRGAVVDGCDIEGTPWWVEVKHHKKPTIADVERWLGEAGLERDERPVLLAFRGDRQPWRFAFALEGQDGIAVCWASEFIAARTAPQRWEPVPWRGRE